MLCYYGCGLEANYPKTKYGKGPCCSSRFYDCPGYKAKLPTTSWSKGLTTETDDRLKSLGDKLKGRVGTFNGKVHTNESKEKISKALNGNRNANHRGDRQSYYGSTRMDSRWEVGVATYLDANNIIWEYGEQGYKLSNGTYYYPDFFIYESDVLIKIIEVKGYFREKNKQKYDLFMVEYPEIKIELWDRLKLVEGGIINHSGYVI